MVVDEGLNTADHPVEGGSKDGAWTPQGSNVDAAIIDNTITGAAEEASIARKSPASQIDQGTTNE